MGQEEVINFLKASPNDWFTCREISNELNITYGSVTMSLKILRENNEVKHEKSEKIIGSRTPFVYKFKK